MQLDFYHGLLVLEHRNRVKRRPSSSGHRNRPGHEHELPAVFRRGCLGQRLQIHVVEDVHAEAGDQERVDRQGDPVAVTVTPAGSPAANYGFDVTPARLVTGLITERGVCAASAEGLGGLYPERRGATVLA